MTRAFDHDLHAFAPGPFGQFADGAEFGQLGGVGGVGEAAGAEAVADGEGDVVLSHDVADGFPAGVHRVLLAFVDHPLGE